MFPNYPTPNPNDVKEWREHLANIKSLIDEQNATGKALQEEIARGEAIHRKYWACKTA